MKSNIILPNINSIYKPNTFSLIICIAVSHILVGNPFFGAGVYLFSSIIKAYYLGDLSKLRKGDGEPYLSKLLLSLVFIAGFSLAFLYPLLQGVPLAHRVSLFALFLIVRDFFGSVPLISTEKRSYKYYISTILIHLAFDLCCAVLIYEKMEESLFYIIMIAVIASSISKIIVPERRLSLDSSIRNRYDWISSYKIFSNMNLYATSAIGLGFMLFLFYMLAPESSTFSLEKYAEILVWLVAILFTLTLCNILVAKRWKGVALAEFTVGAITWGIGTYLMVKGNADNNSILWTTLWGLGITLVFSAINKFYTDFEAVGKVADDKLGREELLISNTIISNASSIITYTIMLLIVVIWTWVLPKLRIDGFGLVFVRWTLTLPIVFMLIALFMSFKQPLDARNREKLLKYVEEHSDDERMRESLERMFVKKYRVRFGAKILCTLVRPFLRLKVTGKENLKNKDYPSVFVCNHGFVYGPVSAVIYLPTYFRPWIHNVMLKYDTAVFELHKSLRVFKKIFGQRLGSKILGWLTKGTCWLLNSFNPIPVVRGSSRDVMSTFELSLQALVEGDNILLFPEKPKELAGVEKTDSSGKIRLFYTGFAHIGKLYYDATGKKLRFYPLFSDKKRRVFKIGEGVEYNPELSPKESKKELAEALQLRMEELQKAE